MIFLSLAVYTYVPTLYLKMIDQFLQHQLVEKKKQKIGQILLQQVIIKKKQEIGQILQQ